MSGNFGYPFQKSPGAGDWNGRMVPAYEGAYVPQNIHPQTQQLVIQPPASQQQKSTQQFSQPQQQQTFHQQQQNQPSSSSSSSSSAQIPSSQTQSAEGKTEGEQDEGEQGGEQGEEEIGVRLLVPNSMVGSIIGKAGSTIKDITVQTNAKIHIAQGDDMSYERVVTISGIPANVSRAQHQICYKMHEDSFADVKDIESELSIDQRVSLLPIKLLVPNAVVGKLIGKGGINLKRTMAETNTFISCSKEDEFTRYIGERVVTIVGNIHDQSKALASVALQIKGSREVEAEGHEGGARGGNQNFGYQQYQNRPMVPAFNPQGARPFRVSQELQEIEDTVYVLVPNGVVGSIIGKSGATVRDIATRSRCQIRVARNDEIDVNASHRPITITGTIDAIFKAEAFLFAKIAEAPPAVGGGPDQPLRIELTIPNDMVGRVIGKKGSQVKKITEMSGARVTINQEEANEDSNMTIVSIVGGLDSNLFAQHRIFEIIYYQSAPGEQEAA